jgi:hypothetical protein
MRKFAFGIGVGVFSNAVSSGLRGGTTYAEYVKKYEDRHLHRRQSRRTALGGCREPAWSRARSRSWKDEWKARRNDGDLLSATQHGGS